MAFQCAPLLGTNSANQNCAQQWSGVVTPLPPPALPFIFQAAPQAIAVNLPGPRGISN